PAEGDEQQALALVPRPGLREPLALEHILALDPLLGEPHVDRVTQRDLEAPGPVERLDQLVRRRLRQVALDALDARQQRELVLPRRDPDLVSGTNVGPLDDRTRPVRLLDLMYADPAENLLGATENLASLGVAKLAPLAVGGQTRASDEPVALPERQRDRRALDLEHLAVHLREERQDLVHEDPECGWRSLGRRAGGSGEDEGDEDGSVRQQATLYHNRCQLLTPDTKVKRGMGDTAHAPSAARSERRLEGEPDARGHRVGVFRVTCRRHAVENLGRVQRFTRCEVSTDDIERHVRVDFLLEPDICLGSDVTGSALP